jgi:hypothetical protein
MDMDAKSMEEAASTAVIDRMDIILLELKNENRFARDAGRIPQPGKFGTKKTNVEISPLEFLEFFDCFVQDFPGK